MQEAHSFSTKLINRFIHKSKINNTDITLLCNNCIGGIILHDLGLKFNTPTINLYFPAPDYLAFLERIDYYINKPVVLLKKSKYDDAQRPYPLGKIEDIELHFVHYKSFEEGKQKWEERVRRIKMNNLFIIGSDRDYCTPEIVDRFLRLPYKNKVFFSSKNIPQKEVLFFDEYLNDKEVGDLIQQDKAWYFYFDTVKWLNTGEIKRTYLRRLVFSSYRFIKKSIKRH